MLSCAFFTLQALVNFNRRLCEQKQATADQNEVAPRNGAS